MNSMMNNLWLGALSVLSRRCRNPHARVFSRRGGGEELSKRVLVVVKPIMSRTIGCPTVASLFGSCSAGPFTAGACIQVTGGGRWRSMAQYVNRPKWTDDEAFHDVYHPQRLAKSESGRVGGSRIGQLHLARILHIQPKSMKRFLLRNELLPQPFSPLRSPPSLSASTTTSGVARGGHGCMDPKKTASHLSRSSPASSSLIRDKPRRKSLGPRNFKGNRHKRMRGAVRRFCSDTASKRVSAVRTSLAPAG